MGILDTNIISELMKATPDRNLLSWVDAQDTNQLFVTSITVAEISYGINALPKGKRRLSLEQAFTAILSEAFFNRVLSFNENAAHMYGRVMSHRKQLGRPFSIADGQIAAIALLNNCAIITSNISDFWECGVELFNPFKVLAT